MESELRFAAEFVKKGFSVFFPYGEDSSVDILIHKNHKFQKVQIKATKPNKGALICKVRSTNNWQDKRYTKKEIDFIGLYDYENQKGYLIPMGILDGLAQFSLRLDAPKNSQKKGINLAENFSYF